MVEAIVCILAHRAGALQYLFTARGVAHAKKEGHPKAAFLLLQIICN